MKTTNSRGSNARNEARDSQGRFTSKDSSSNNHSGRGSNAANEARDSQGRFTSKESGKNSTSHRGRSSK